MSLVHIREDYDNTGQILSNVWIEKDVKVKNGSFSGTIINEGTIYSTGDNIVTINRNTEIFGNGFLDGNIEILSDSFGNNYGKINGSYEVIFQSLVPMTIKSTCQIKGGVFCGSIINNGTINGTTIRKVKIGGGRSGNLFPTSCYASSFYHPMHKRLQIQLPTTGTYTSLNRIIPGDIIYITTINNDTYTSVVDYLGDGSNQYIILKYDLGTYIGTGTIKSIQRELKCNITNNGNINECDIDNLSSITGGTLSGTIKNTIGSLTGGNLYGTIRNSCLITNCNNTGTINGGTLSGTITNTIGTLTNCTNTGTINGGTLSGNITNTNATINNCTNNGSINGGSINNCTNNGSINDGSINICINNRTISACNLSGIITNTNATINNCTNTGTINGGSINTCINNGTISACNLSGTITNTNATINNCTNTGTITGGSIIICTNNGTITSVNLFGVISNNGNINGSTIDSNSIITGGTLSGTILNNGIINRSTVDLSGTINGGTLSGTISNNGNINGSTINSNSIITGGTLSGTILNNGSINGSTINSNSIITGGYLYGTISNNGKIIRSIIGRSFISGTLSSATYKNDTKILTMTEGFFTTELVPGDILYINTLNNSYTRAVGSIFSNTSLRLEIGLGSNFNQNEIIYITKKVPCTIIGGDLSGNIINSGIIKGSNINSDAIITGGSLTTINSVEKLVNNGTISSALFSGIINNNGIINKSEIGRVLITGNLSSAIYIDISQTLVMMGNSLATELVVNDVLYIKTLTNSYTQKVLEIKNNGSLLLNKLGTDLNYGDIIYIAKKVPCTIIGGNLTENITNDGTIVGSIINSNAIITGGTISSINDNLLENNGTIVNALLSCPITNNGTISGGQNKKTIFSGTLAGNIQNDGTIDGGLNGCTINLNSIINGGIYLGSIINNGTISNGELNGTILNNGTISLSKINGSLSNNGTINGGQNNGTITEGSSTTNINGSLIINSNIDTTTLTNYAILENDIITIHGNVSIDSSYIYPFYKSKKIVVLSGANLLKTTSSAILINGEIEVQTGGTLSRGIYTTYGLQLAFNLPDKNVGDPSFEITNPDDINFDSWRYESSATDVATISKIYQRSYINIVGMGKTIISAFGKHVVTGEEMSVNTELTIYKIPNFTFKQEGRPFNSGNRTYYTEMYGLIFQYFSSLLITDPKDSDSPGGWRYDIDWYNPYNWAGPSYNSYTNQTFLNSINTQYYGVLNLYVTQLASGLYREKTIVAPIVAYYDFPTIQKWVLPDYIVENNEYDLFPPSSNSPGSWNFSDLSKNNSFIVVNNKFKAVKKGIINILANQDATSDYVYSSSDYRYDEVYNNYVENVPIVGQLIVYEKEPEFSLDNWASFIEKIVGDPIFLLSHPNSNSNGSWNFSVPENNGIVEITETGYVTIINYGSVEIKIKQLPTSDNVFCSKTIIVTLNVSLGEPSIEPLILPSDKKYTDVDFVLTNPNSNSSGTWNYSVPTGNTVATVYLNNDDGKWYVHILGAGQIIITATQSTDSTYYENSVNSILTISKLVPTLSENNNTTKIVYGETIQIRDPVTNNDQNPTWTYSVSSNIVSLSNNSLTAIGIGSVDITMTSSETSNYYGHDFTYSLEVKKAKPSLTNFINEIKTILYPNYQISNPDSHSDGIFNFESSNTDIATITDTGLISIKKQGSTQIKAQQSEGTYYLSSDPIYKILTVNDARTPLLNFSLPSKNYGETDFQIEASSNSDGSLSYSSSNTRVATISANGVVHIVGPGLTEITVSVSQTFEFYANSKKEYFYVKLSVSSGSDPIIKPVFGPKFSLKPNVKYVNLLADYNSRIFINAKVDMFQLSDFPNQIYWDSGFVNTDTLSHIYKNSYYTRYRITYNDEVIEIDPDSLQVTRLSEGNRIKVVNMKLKTGLKSISFDKEYPLLETTKAIKVAFGNYIMDIMSDIQTDDRHHLELTNLKNSNVKNLSGALISVMHITDINDIEGEEVLSLEESPFQEIEW